VERVADASATVGVKICGCMLPSIPNNLPCPDTVLLEQTLLLFGGATEPVGLLLIVVEGHVGF
jgi:hypothetical protein